MDDSIDKPLSSPLSVTCSHVQDATDCLPTSHHDDFNRPSDLIPTITPSKGPVDYILHFLSSSDNSTLAGVAASLAIVTYVLLGRIGLLLIGLVAGVALHASWESVDTGLNGDQRGIYSFHRRKELSLNIANRLLELSSRKPSGPESNNGGNIAKAAEQISEPELDFSGFPPKTAAALRSLTNAVIKDYVNHWYEPILPAEQMFPVSCRKLLTGFIISLSSHLSRKRPTDAFLEFLTNSSSMVIVLLNELSAAFQHAEGQLTPEDAVKRYLDLHPESSLANILSEQQQRLKLKMVADDILSRFLEPGAYACSVLREFLREILAGVVLESTISNLSRSETINGWIIHLLNEGESELLSAIDAGVERAKEQVVAVEGAHGENKTTTVPFGTSDIEGESARHSGRYGILPTTKVAEVPIYPPESPTVRTQDLEIRTALLSSSADVQSSYSQSARHSLVGTQDKEATIHTPKAKGAAQTPNDCDTTNIESTAHYPPVQPPDPSLASPVAHLSESPSKISPVTTLHRASVSVEDLSEASEKGSIRSKPTSSYLIQIEPAVTRRTGWMIFRNYADFESLHGTLGTIARLNNIQDFAESHPVLPPWKGQTKVALVRNLERYLKDALQYEALANCERMKRFLEKDERLDPGASNASAKSGFPFPTSVAFENMGKGMLGVLTNAPKGVAEGGKAVIGGVTGVFGGANGKKTSLSSEGHQGNHGRSLSTRSISQMNDESTAFESVIRPNRPVSENDKTESCSLALATTLLTSNSQDVPAGPGSREVANSSSPMFRNLPSSDSKLESHHLQVPLSDSDGENNMGSCSRPKEEQKASVGQTTGRRQESPISQEETQIAVELMFAVINELYSLSSAWNIRRTLLNAAKSYILRPGSPSLETIRSLLQKSMIDVNTSDTSIASYLTKLRENALPTKEELDSWPQSPSGAEKERMRGTARKTLILKGLPQALTSVMGTAASRESLERVFDCLQVEMIARGFVFSILLQALRALTF